MRFSFGVTPPFFSSRLPVRSLITSENLLFSLAPLGHCAPGWTHVADAGLPSAQHLLQLLHLQLPHPSVDGGQLREVSHLHRVDDRLRGDSLDDPHHHDIFACTNSSRLEEMRSAGTGSCGCWLVKKMFAWGSINGERAFGWISCKNHESQHQQ